ncbi:MAG TPA: hypothetical protein DCL75_01835 [Ktedonobacter sp.]|nr:hypothetical protein [Ktedonobacter sp.]HAG97621.1 hypothetical protein [Ktedonobacter sp.]HAT46788.1 hypothetical protein [Ktedonobacter sp.]HBE27590.1 hypothetical protein [Ktedonobacter sp.]HCF86501.1 hypothetical protein [Ktedonobacter sp.]
MRIDSLPYSNIQTQGAQRRERLRQQSPQHLEQCSSLILRALRERQADVSRNALVLGAGACTEIPLAELVRGSDEVILADLDLASMRQGANELLTPSLRKRMLLVQCDISGGVSTNLSRLLAKQSWDLLVSRGAQAVFDIAAECLEQCLVPDPPELEGVDASEFGLVISSLVLSQLFSYPLLDVLDHVQRIAPELLGEQERHRRYQQAAADFRLRIIQAHLHLLRKVVERDGTIVLLSDIRGFVFDVYGTDHDAEHRRSMPLVPRVLPDLVGENFTVLEEHHWEWLTDLPTKGRPGRGYEVVGYMLK